MMKRLVLAERGEREGTETPERKAARGFSLTEHLHLPAALQGAQEGGVVGVLHHIWYALTRRDPKECGEPPAAALPLYHLVKGKGCARFAPLTGGGPAGCPATGGKEGWR